MASSGVFIVLQADDMGHSILPLPYSTEWLQNPRVYVVM